jgi:hypothetical protein
MVVFLKQCLVVRGFSVWTSRSRQLGLAGPDLTPGRTAVFDVATMLARVSITTGVRIIGMKRHRREVTHGHRPTKVEATHQVVVIGQHLEVAGFIFEGNGLLGNGVDFLYVGVVGEIVAKCASYQSRVLGIRLEKPKIVTPGCVAPAATALTEGCAEFAKFLVNSHVLPLRQLQLRSQFAP